MTITTCKSPPIMQKQNETTCTVFILQTKGRGEHVATQRTHAHTQTNTRRHHNHTQTPLTHTPAHTTRTQHTHAKRTLCSTPHAKNRDVTHYARSPSSKHYSHLTHMRVSDKQNANTNHLSFACKQADCLFEKTASFREAT
jgi:hypothetical protein